MAGQIPTARRRPAGGLLRTRNFGLFWLGESVSGFGSAITTVALPLVAVSTHPVTLGKAPAQLLGGQISTNPGAGELACGLDPGALP